ncbi:MAG: ABC transporter substrate-binding protein [Pseudomonadota bacterium]
MKRFARLATYAVAAFGLLAAAQPAAAADKVRVGVFPVSSALPYFVALDRGYFADEDIETEAVRLMGGPAIVGAMFTGDIDAAANLVTIEGMNANTRRAGVLSFISINAQNKEFRMEQFVARSGLEVASLAELAAEREEPLKVMSAPGPANMVAARAVLSAIGLTEREDYTMTELAMNLHVDAMKAGTFDLGYTLEPTATVMVNAGAATSVEAGVISSYILGRDEAKAFAAGGALTGAFMEERPEVAARFAAAWRKALADIESDPATRELLKGNTFTPPDVAMTMPMPQFMMVDQLSDEDRADFQALIDFATENGVLDENVDTSEYLVVLDEPAS